MVVITDGEQTTEGPYNRGCRGFGNSRNAYKFDPAELGLEGEPLVD